MAVKATYDILPDGSTRVSADQPPVNAAPVPHRGLQSLRYESDLGPPKPATDVMLIGHAYVQHGMATTLSVAWGVGHIRRSARITGDRFWKVASLGIASRPESFACMPLTWERAKVDAQANPLGRGNEAEGRRVYLPNIESTGRFTANGKRHPPIGFGPIPSHWQPRRSYGGTYDHAWMQTRRPLQPEDLDPRHWQVAPVEQQVHGRLRGGETAALVNLTPPGFASDGRIGFTLPRLTLAFETRFYDGSVATSRSVIHSVILEPDMPRVSIVHHMNLPCHAKVNLLDRTIVREKSRPLDTARTATDAAMLDS